MIALVGVPAIAELQASEVPLNEALSVLAAEPGDGGIAWGQSGSISGSIPPDVWQVMQSQTGSLGGTLGGYENIFSGSALPEDIWNIAKTQLELPESIEQILSGSILTGSRRTGFYSYRGLGYHAISSRITRKLRRRSLRWLRADFHRTE